MTGGILLAGGASRRMGRDKAALPLAGVALGERVHAALAAACTEVVVVTNARFPVPAARTVRDRTPGRGPLEGLASGLEALESARGLLVACDMPFVTPALLRRLASEPDDAEAIVPFTARGPEPLLALYSRRALPKLRAALDGGERRMLGALDRLEVRYVPHAALALHDEGGRAFWNLNRPEDYAIAQAHLRAD